MLFHSLLGSRCDKPTRNGFRRQPTRQRAWRLALALLVWLSGAACTPSPPTVERAGLAPSAPTATSAPPAWPTPPPASTAPPTEAPSTPTAAPAATTTPTITPTPTLAPPTPTPARGVRFAVIGDFGWEGPDAAAVAALVRSWSPDFIVTTGDNNYPAGEAATIDRNLGQYYHEFIAPYRGRYGSGAAVNRFFPALGNHDLQTQNGAPYLAFFDLPGVKRYYTINQGPVDLFILNSMPGEPDGVAPNSRQAAWLRDALAASTACWKLVVMHHPAYSSALHGSNAWMQWPYKAWGADAVLAGHDHVYERLVVDGLVYFTNGLGGAPRYDFKAPLPGSQARYNATHGALQVEVDPGRLGFAFITRGGEVVDRYELSKACP